MKYAPKKQILLCVSVLLGGTILSTFAAVLVLRNLGGLVGMFVEADADVIMTHELVKLFDAVKNMQYTAERIAESVLSIRDETELQTSRFQAFLWRCRLIIPCFSITNSLAFSEMRQAAEK